MTELLWVKVKGWGFKTLWPAVVVPPSDIPLHIQVKAKGRQVVKFFNTKASDQFGIAPFKETQSFYHHIDPNVFSKNPMLFKAYTDALEYAETNDLCKSQMDVLPEMLFVEIFSHIDWHSRVKLESVSRKRKRILFDRSLRDIDRIDLHEIVRFLMPENELAAPSDAPFDSANTSMAQKDEINGDQTVESTRWFSWVPSTVKALEEAENKLTSCFGRSSRIKFNSDPAIAEREWVESVEDWRKEMKPDKFILLGHSLGGFIASAYALTYSDRIRHLILADPWGFPVQSTDNPRRSNAPSFPAL